MSIRRLEEILSSLTEKELDDFQFIISSNKTNKAAFIVRLQTLGRETSGKIIESLKIMKDIFDYDKV